MNVVYTHKGATHLYLTTLGKAAHASNPQAGVNAIYAMADVIQALRQKVAPLITAHQHPVLGASTMSIGTIHGGSKTNIVPDRCELSVDIRTVPDQITPAFLETIEATLLTACPSLRIKTLHSAPLHTDPGHPLIDLLAAGGARRVGAPWFCDAAVFARNGSPAIAMGPGSIAQAHTEDEWLSIADLEQGARLFAKFIRAL